MVSSSAIYTIDLYCQNLKDPEGVLGLKTHHHVQVRFENSILVLDSFDKVLRILGMITDNYSTCQCNKRIPPQKKAWNPLSTTIGEIQYYCD